MKNFKIRTFNKISENGLKLFDKNKYEVSDSFENYDSILLRSFKLHDTKLDDNLLAIARAGAGVNNIPIDNCSEKGIVVFNTPGANANGVKELVIMSLMLASRDIIGGIEWVKTLDGKGEEVPKLVEKGKSQFAGPEIEGKKLGVIGLGAIGVMVANSAQSLGMTVIGYDPYISVEAAWGLSRNVKKSVDLSSLISECDYISIHVPLNDKTKGMLNKDLFAKMKNDVIILNFSRAGLVNTTDLIKAIEDKKVSKYVTDFPVQDLIGKKEVIQIPHLGASTPESEDNCAYMACKQTIDYLENGIIVNSVNFPDCDLARSSKYRITITHKNIPNMLGQISTVLAENDFNIINMENRSSGDYAYTIIDINTEVSEEVEKKLNSIDGILKLRLL